MSSAASASIGPQRLHPGAAFEGFYTKFTLPSGASLILIPCSIPGAPDAERRHSLSIVHIPAATSSGPGTPWTYETHPSRIFTSVIDKKTDEFALVCINSDQQEIASFSSTPTENTYNIWIPSLSLRFTAMSSKRTPWTARPTMLLPSSPEGLQSYLPLPLHWHVHSLASQTRFELELPSEAGQNDSDREGQATAHEEKNWANGFPSAHVWCQARSPPGVSTFSLSGTVLSARHSEDEGNGGKAESGICLAGGHTMGLIAFLVGYRHKSTALGELEIDFRPPFAVGLPWGGSVLSPLLDFYVDWPARRWRVDVANRHWRIVVEASGPGADLPEEERKAKRGWFHLSSPKPEGFVQVGMAQTAAGTVKIKLFSRRFGWFGWGTFWEWREVSEEVFKGAGVEFGGDYYQP